MNSTKPNIGVTGPDKGGISAWWFTKLAVWLQGGRAIRIRPSKLNVEKLDGLILGGGADLNPGRYGKSGNFSFSNEAPNPKGVRGWLRRIFSFVLYPLLFVMRKLFATKTPGVDPERDELEFSLLEEAIQQNIPVLGICRGAQLINVHFGGDLHPDIGNFYTEIPQMHTVWPKKKVKLLHHSLLAKIIQAEYIWVNALHHQAVDQPGKNINVVAVEENMLPQAIEHENHPYLIGVQWHPEYMPQIPRQRALFKALVDQAAQSESMRLAETKPSAG